MMRRLPPIARIFLLLFFSATTTLGADRRGPFVAPPGSIRSRNIDQQHLRLELRFDFEHRQVQGRAVHTLTPLEPLETITVDAAAMKVQGVALADESGKAFSGKSLTFDQPDQQLVIRLDRTYGPNETVRLAIDYQVSEPQQGIRFIDAAAGDARKAYMAWTQSEPDDARYWIPCFDSPSDRLTSEVLVTVPQGMFALSNGALKSKADNPDRTTTWHWSQEPSHVTYLISVAAGEFEAYEQSWEGVPIVSYVPKGRLADAARCFAKTPAMVAFFSDRIGYRYPWAKYAQICVDNFIAGGMENTSATTLTGETLHDERAHLDGTSDGLVAHELAHQWWGDLLTCKDWGELWLNESFATYFATVWMAHDLGEDEAAWRRHEEAESYFAEDKDRYRRPLVTFRYQSPWQMFDRHSYPKGARVLHMLRFVLGEERFWKAIRHYCHKHAFHSVETADFRMALEEATGQGLGALFDQWVYHGGHPEYEVHYRWDEAQKSVVLSVKQTQAVDELTPLFSMPVEIELATSSGTETRRITVARAEETFHLAMPQRPCRVCFDPQDWILKKVSFPKSQQEWLDQVKHDGHVMCRFAAVEALAKLPRDEEVVAVLTKVALDDSFWAVRCEAIKVLAKASGDTIRTALLRLAENDPKPAVRAAAVKALAGFSHADTRNTLRAIAKKDPSYSVVAETLRTLVLVDRAGCREELRAALDQPSHREVILRAAAEGLAELDDPQLAPKLRSLLDEDLASQRCVAVMSTLARLAKGDPTITAALARHLNDSRRDVRRAAADALGKTGDPAAIDLLLARRDKETSNWVIPVIDESLSTLRAQQQHLDKIGQNVEALRRENRMLQERLQKLEEAAGRK